MTEWTDYPVDSAGIELADVDIADEMFDRMDAIDGLRTVELDEEER
jgi:hypothetical protein